MNHFKYICFLIILMGSTKKAYSVEVPENQCRGVWHNSTFEVVKCKIDGNDYIVANKISSGASGISIIPATTSK